ncbi:6-deoxy-6-sulfogluconolactonase [Lasiodiplodia theobromae]|uniref:6-deoxy-6-sulfogluconolactonase n=1 Tax=Lasiodiplodia theobromae TaxID=45133 RepID=A0A5N5D8P7_9PEZI|nr:6-deoxy-6-sulfogluconolactonase [Lasiodiplodia theobromae]
MSKGFSANMNFYPAPPVIEARIWVRIPDELRCTGQATEWKGGSALPFSGIFLEGPTTDSQGNVFVTDIPYGRILKIDAEKNVSECVRYDGEPNGMVLRGDGLMVVADYKQGLLLFDPSTQTISPHLTRRNLERFKGPNDLIVSSTGELFFTDQGQTGITDPTGAVYRQSQGSRLDCLLHNGVSPNGLALTPDEHFLYVAMTRANAVWRLPLNADGSSTKAGVFFQSFGNAGPDGLAVDEEGSLFVCHPSLGCVFVVDKDGIPKARIAGDARGGRNLTNCTFGGPENKTLFITDSMEGNIQVVEWHCAGALRPHASRQK